MDEVMKDLLEALKGLLVRVADDEEYGPDHAVTIARAAIARAEAEAQQERLLQDMHDAGREIDRMLSKPQPDAESIMARDDVIRMAQESDIEFQAHVGAIGRLNVTTCGSQPVERIERFAHLVIADFLQRTGQYVTNDASREAALEQAKAEEREACTKVCDELFPPPGEQMTVEWAAGTVACANAIRARGQK